MVVVALALALQAQVPFSLPPSFGKPKALTFGSTVTVVVPAVPAPPAQALLSAEVLAAGRKLYQQRCALCHGDAGAADGIGARRVQPEPQHLNDVIWQANVSDDEITKAILEGGAAVSRSPMMPANPDWKAKPDAVKALVAYVRSLRAPFGSVLGSLSLADQNARTSWGLAGRDGTATVVFRDVPKGKAKLMVLVDGKGTVRCQLDLDVTADTNLTCK